ncbi:MAG: hypothetical protein M3Q08_18155 [Pseudomonadota bacterium]|nr:hypothetical protein [Pseudomonadota bacterium]
MPFEKGNPGGPGRPRKTDKFAGQIAAAEQRIADTLPSILEAQLLLAHGGFEEVEEEWQPARLVTIGSGELEQPAFPELPPDQLVLVKRKHSIAAPDRAAGQYLIDRILGKPTSSVEVSDPDGGPLKVIIQYADADDHLAPPASGPAADQAGSEAL